MRLARPNLKESVDPVLRTAQAVRRGAMWHGGRLWLATAILVPSAPLVVHADGPRYEVAGPARIEDGDTLRIGAQAIRLHGIDAPEDGQDCERADGSSYNCGADAENALRRLTRGGARCTGTRFDGYRRLIATCSSGGVEDLSAEMVRRGHALAYRRYSVDYVSEEAQAEAAERGVWQGSFTSPWAFREAAWTASDAAAPDPECPIKGNVASDGERIYHAPWSRSYKRTRIDEAKGERWFCSEAQALDAGWRAPLR